MEPIGKTRSHYNTNEQGLINAGPYLGLTLEEAKSLNTTQREDYSTYRKNKRREDYQTQFADWQQEFSDDYIAPAVNNTLGLTPLAPLTTLANVGTSLYSGNYGDAGFSSILEAIPYASKVIPKGVVQRGSKYLLKEMKDIVTSPSQVGAGILYGGSK